MKKNRKNLVLAPGVSLRVTRTALLDQLPRKVAEEAGATGLEGQSDVVLPAKGQRFLVATYTSTDPQWKPKEGTTPEATVRFLLAGNEAGNAFSTAQGTQHHQTAVVSVPKNPKPEDAALQVEVDEQFQTLSLVTGERLDTDVPQVYNLGTRAATVSHAKKVEHSFTGFTDDTYVVGGKVIDAFVTPYLNSEEFSEGWSSPGTVYLGAEIDWRMTDGGGSFDKSTIHLTLPDGTTIRPANDASSITNRFEHYAVFEIPAKTTKAKLVIKPTVSVGGGGNEVHKWKPITTTISIN